MELENQFTNDGEIKNNRQKPRIIVVDDVTWDLVLTHKQKQSISEFIRDLIKKQSGVDFETGEHGCKIRNKKV